MHLAVGFAAVPAVGLGQQVELDDFGNTDFAVVVDIVLLAFAISAAQAVLVCSRPRG